MTEYELKPCPFCGGEAASFSEDAGGNYKGDNVYMASVGCTECGAGFERYHEGDDLSTDEDDREDGMHCYALEAQLVEAWNRRVGEEER